MYYVFVAELCLKKDNAILDTFKSESKNILGNKKGFINVISRNLAEKKFKILLAGKIQSWDEFMYFTRSVLLDNSLHVEGVRIKVTLILFPFGQP